MPNGPVITDGTLAKVLTLQADYARFVDTRDAKSWGDLFGADGILAVGKREIRGKDAIAEFGATSSRGVHVQAVPHVESRTDGGLEATSSFVFVNGETGALIAGIYRDELAPDGDGFIFARRQIDMLVRTKPA